ncbi:MAG: ribulose-phosphate 3-epimerase [Bdellovibrionota bacterium]
MSQLHSKSIIVSPSLLSCDFANIEREVKAVTEAGADWLHVDVMDGHFVNNITIGPPVVRAIKKVSKLPLDVHLMIENPEKYVDAFIKAGSDYLTIHVEATKEPLDVLRKIKSQNVNPGITLRPSTNLSEILPFLDEVAMVLIMTVEPGFGGQSFMPEQVEKIKILKKEIEKRNLDIHIEVDGGINKETAKICRDAGANAFVSGSYIFDSGKETASDFNDAYKKAIQSLR